VEHRALAGARRTVLSAGANHAGARLREAAGDALAVDAALVVGAGLAGAGIGDLHAARLAGRSARAHHRGRGHARIILAGTVQAALAGGTGGGAGRRRAPAVAGSPTVAAAGRGATVAAAAVASVH